MRKLLIFLLSIGLSQSVFSMTGLELAKLVDEKNKGFNGEKASMEMILIDAYGQKVTREMTSLTLEGALQSEESDKSLMTFLRPSDVKGTKMLTWSQKTKDDDQWLYLPSLRRVKRISSSNRFSSFMGSEFTYEDLSSVEVDKYTYKLLADEKVNGVDCWVLERFPKRKSGYSKVKSWISKDIYNPVKAEYYNRRGELFKKAEIKDYKKYEVGGKTLYRSSSIEMENIQTRKKSIFIWKERELGKKFPTRTFKKSELK